MALAAAAAAAVVLLALWRVDVAVIVGVLLLGVVRVEPSPSDAFFAVAMLVVVLTRRHELHRVPRWAAAVVAVLVVANLVSLMNAPGARSGLTYFAVTLYLLALALWLAAYIDRTSRARAIVIALTVAAVTSAILGSLAVLAPIPGRDLFVFKGCCRAQGLFKDPNVFGPFLIPPLLILLHEALYPRLFSRRSSSADRGLHRHPDAGHHPVVLPRRVAEPRRRRRRDGGRAVPAPRRHPARRRAGGHPRLWWPRRSWSR